MKRSDDPSMGLFAASVLLIALPACTGSNGGPATGSPSMAACTSQLEVRSADGVLTSCAPARLDVFNGKFPGIELVIGAGSGPGGAGWTASGKVSRASALAGKATLTLTDREVDEGAATVEL